LGETNLNRVLVAGGAGLVGAPLVRALLARGASVSVLSRRPGHLHLPPGAAAHGWEDLRPLVEGADAIFNLAGEGIADGRWTPRRKAAIRESRVLATRRIVAAMEDCGKPPGVLVNASAIGFYGARDAVPVDEGTPSGSGFLPEVCRAWEAEAQAAAASGGRVVCLRIGVVLARQGGALPRMALPIRCFLGSRLGSGSQGLSWIHLDDLVALFLEAALNPAWEGAVNATAPEPMSHGAFTRLLARRLHRPLWPIPDILTRSALKLLLGEMAEALLLEGAFVLPARAQALGFSFRFPTAAGALDHLL